MSANTWPSIGANYWLIIPCPMTKGKSIVLMPDKPIQTLRGILKDRTATDAAGQGGKE